MRIYSFKRLIKRYQVSGATVSTFVNQKGHYDDEGNWIAPAYSTEVAFKGAIVPFSSQQIYTSSGRYTASDRQIISLVKLNTKDEITYRNSTYVIEAYADYDEYGDFFVYTGKAVSAFDKDVGDTREPEQAPQDSFESNNY